MESVMCKQKIVLETIKKMKGSGGMTSVQQQLAEAQCEDYQTMKKEILEIKSDVSSLKIDFLHLKQDNQYIKGQLDIVVKSLQPKEKETFSQKMSALKEIPVWFWIMMIVLICTIGAISGANMEWIKGAFHITGGQ